MKESRENIILRASSAAGKISDGMRPAIEFCEGLQKVMQPVADLQKQIQAIWVPRFEQGEYQAAINKLLESQRQIAAAVQKFNLGPIMAAAEVLGRHFGNAKALDDAGWLPHHSTPFDRCGKYWGDTDALHTLLSRHYTEKWVEIRREIEVRVMQYDVDDEAKATFHEALEAHEAGLYRSVCRVILPELERISRKELHGDSMNESVTGQKLFRELTGKLPFGSVDPVGFYSFQLFRRMSEHLYEHISSENDRKRFELDPVPNRHAAVHGLVVYSSMQNSLNALFMAEYIIQVIHTLKNLMNTTSVDRGG